MCCPRWSLGGSHYANRPGGLSQKSGGAPEARRAAFTSAALAMVEHGLDCVLHGAAGLIDMVQYAQLQTLGIRLVFLA